MGFQDRHYYRERQSGPWDRLWWFLGGSVPLFTLFGIRVRAHIWLIIMIALELLFARTEGGLGPRNAFTSMSILFISVLLHEFGHCFAARAVGGEATDILMWPLGGLASTNPPRRPLPSFLTTAAGPAVNLVICLLCGTFICIREGSIRAIPWLPVFQPLKTYVPTDDTVYYVWWVFLVNYSLFMFNMCLVFYPFDAGRMIQEALWWRLGYRKSMQFATVFGMVGAVVAAAVGMVLGWLTLILIAAFGFYTCYQQRQALLTAGPYDLDDDGIDYSAAYEPYHRRKPKVSRWAAKRAAKIARADQAEQERIDKILAKVSAHGMHSLSWFERRALKKATEHQRERDIETGRLRRP
jgi:Zn-dependent protease